MKKILLFVLLLVALGLTGCELSSLEEEESIDELQLIPKVLTSNQQAKSASNQKPTPYSCLISTLANDEADYNYWNQSFWVQFPKPAVDQADGKTIFKAFSFNSEDAGKKAGSWAGQDNIVRVAQCVIPDSRLAETLLEEQLTKFGKGTWLENLKTQKAKSVGGNFQANSGEWECSKVFVTVNCSRNIETGELYDCKVTEIRCIEYTYVEEDDGTGGGGGGGFGGDDPGECDPLGIEPCYDDGGGSSLPPPEPDPCKEYPLGDPERPVYCDKPCDETDDEIIKTWSKAQVLEKLWLASFGKFINGDPPPQDERKEKGGWGVIQDGEEKFVYFPDDLEAIICGIKIIPPPPPGAFAIIHTHPMFPGELVKDPSCVKKTLDEIGITDPDIRSQAYERGVRYNQEPSRPDLAYAEEYELTSYYMDGTIIEKYHDGTTNQQVTELQSRCGF